MTRISSIFYRYLVSYIGLAVLTCTLLGVILFSHYAKMLTAEVERVNKHKLSQIALDLESQYTIMSDIALKISVSVYYKPFNLQTGVSHEQDLLDDFGKYTEASPIADKYFFFYKGENRLYKQNAKNSFHLYFVDILHIDNPYYYIDQVKSVTQKTILTATADGQPLIIFAFPVSTLSLKREEGQGVLCFVTSKATLEERARNIAGELTGQLIINYYGMQNITIYDSTYGATIQDTTLTAYSSDDMIKVSFVQDGNFYVSAGLMAIKDIGLAMIIAFSVILLLLATLLAYGSYRPIKRLNDMEHSFSLSSERITGSNELERIGSTLRHLAESNTRNTLELKTQKTLLIRHIVNTLIEDGYNEDICLIMQTADMKLPGDLFCVFSVDIKYQQDEQPESNEENITTMIQTLSGEGFALYPGIQRPNKCYTILVVFAGSDQREKVYKSICAASNCHFSKITFGLSGVYDNLDETPAAYLESQIALNMATVSNKQRVCYFDNASDMLSWYDNDLMLQLIKSVQLGQQKQAIECLDGILSQLQHCPKVVAIQRHVCSGILANMINAMCDMNISIDNKNIIRAITIQNLMDFENSITVLISNICQKINERRNNVKVIDIMEYIDKCFAMYDMGLKHLEDKFQIPSYRLSRMILEATGYHFKQYLTILRIERAKSLLMNEQMLIHKVSEEVGYSSVSHFIHNFIKFVKCTPTQFVTTNKKQH